MQKQGATTQIKHHELEIEHRFKNQVVGRRVLRPQGEMTVIGSSPLAHLRLVGEDVSGIHALIEFDQENWNLNDLGSEQGTWIDKKPVVTRTIEDNVTVRIGSHELRLIPHVSETNLFDSTQESPVGKGTDLFHQVVVRRSGLVLHTHTLPAKKSFMLRTGTDTLRIDPPAKSQEGWSTRSEGELTIQNRVIRADVIKGSAKADFTDLIDGEMRWPLIGACLLGAIMIFMIALAPKNSLEDAKFLVPNANKFTKVVMDPRITKTAQTANETEKPKTEPAKAQTSPQPKQATAAPAAPPKATVRVVNSIKASGLSQLVGKVSKRASKNAILIQGAGQTAGKPSGPASFNMGQTKSTLGGGQLRGGSSFKIGGIGTLGKAGGDTGYAKQGALSTGGVGDSAVGLLEEESEVQGGLEKEEIARVIRTQLGEIRYCYERQLSANPDLFGKVLVKFSINGSGGVSAQSIKSSTLANAMVEGCMLRRVANWRFPKPVGGTTVLVTYPFLFKSTN